MNAPEWTAQLERRALEIVSSYRKWTGRNLGGSLPPIDGIASWLFDLSVVVVAHGTESDPILNFGNRRALDLWEASWGRLTAMPSRLTAEPMHRDERAVLLERVTRHGFIDDYSGIRISSTGKRFRIRKALVWNVVDIQGNPAGQAATFDAWEWL